MTDPRPCANCVDEPGTRERYVEELGGTFLLCRKCERHLAACGALPEVKGVRTTQSYGGDTPKRATSDHAFDAEAVAAVRRDHRIHNPDPARARRIQAMAKRNGEG